MREGENPVRAARKDPIWLQPGEGYVGNSGLGERSWGRRCADTSILKAYSSRREPGWALGHKSWADSLTIGGG